MRGCLNRSLTITPPNFGRSPVRRARELSRMAPQGQGRRESSARAQRKREAGLSAQQRNALNIDFEEEEVKDQGQYLPEDEDEVDAGELPEGFEDEEISSDEDGAGTIRKRRADDESRTSSPSARGRRGGHG